MSLANSTVASRRWSRVFLRDRADAAVNLRQGLRQIECAVRRPVVYNDQLPRRERLRDHAIDSGAQKVVAVVCGHHDADCRWGHEAETSTGRRLRPSRYTAGRKWIALKYDQESARYPARPARLRHLLGLLLGGNTVARIRVEAYLRQRRVDDVHGILLGDQDPEPV